MAPRNSHDFALMELNCSCVKREAGRYVSVQNGIFSQFLCCFWRREQANRPCAFYSPLGMSPPVCHAIQEGPRTESPLLQRCSLFFIFAQFLNHSNKFPRTKGPLLLLLTPQWQFPELVQLLSMLCFRCVCVGHGWEWPSPKEIKMFCWKSVFFCGYLWDNNNGICLRRILYSRSVIIPVHTLDR